MAGSKVALGCVSKCSAGRLAPPPGKPPENGALTGQLSHRTPVGQLFTLGARVKLRNCPADVLWDNFFALTDLSGRGVRAIDARRATEQDDPARGPGEQAGTGISRLGRTAQIRGTAEVCREGSAPICSRPRGYRPTRPRRASKLEVSQDALPARPRGQVSTLSTAYRFVVNATPQQEKLATTVDKDTKSSQKRSRRSGSPIPVHQARRGVAGDVTCWQLDLRIGCGENETERSPELQPVDKVRLEPADP
jgi:hypothetical protein